MIWNKVWQFVFGGSLMMANPVPVAPPLIYVPATVEELLSYQCGRDVSSMLSGPDQPGPVFSSGLLILTSTEARNGDRLLIVNAGAGTFVLPLAVEGVNRLRFTIPTQTAPEPREFFLSYVHGYRGTRSRIFESSINSAPMGKDILDYTPVHPARAENMREHLDYGIFQTASNMVSALREGRLERQLLQRGRAENCEHITREQPAVGRILRASLDQMENIYKGSRGERPAKLRMPASMSSAAYVAP